MMPSFRGKATKAGSILAPGLFPALRKQASPITCGTATAIRSVAGWRWREQRSRKFRNWQVTRRLPCRRATATCHRNTAPRSLTAYLHRPHSEGEHAPVHTPAKRQATAAVARFDLKLFVLLVPGGGIEPP